MQYYNVKWQEVIPQADHDHFKEILEQLRCAYTGNIDSLTYRDQYFWLVSGAKKRGLDKNKLGYYTEKHHIVPRCIGGKDEDENYVLFLAIEHIMAHLLLYLGNPDNSSLEYAAHQMLKLSVIDRSLMEQALMDLNLEDLSDKLWNGRKLTSLKTRKSILCYDEKYTVYKAYSGGVDVVDDGFSPKPIPRCIQDQTYSEGFLWEYTDKFEVDHPKEFKEYLDRKEEFDMKYCKKIRFGISSSTSTKRKMGSIVLTDLLQGDKIIRIFENVFDLQGTGFSRRVVMKRLKDNPEHDIEYGLFRIRLLSDFGLDHKREVEEYWNTPQDKLPLLSRKCKEVSTAVVVHQGNKVIKFFESMSDLSGIVDIGTLRVMWRYGASNYRGYEWTKLENWPRDKWIGLREANEPLNLADPIHEKRAIQAFNLSGELIKEIPSLQTAEWLGYNHLEILKVLGTTKQYKDLLWKRK